MTDEQQHVLVINAPDCGPELYEGTVERLKTLFPDAKVEHVVTDDLCKIKGQTFDHIIIDEFSVYDAPSESCDKKGKPKPVTYGPAKRSKKGKNKRW